MHREEWRKIVRGFFYDKFFVSLKTPYDLKETVSGPGLLQKSEKIIKITAHSSDLQPL